MLEILCSYFASYDALVSDGQTYFNLKYIHPNFLNYVLQNIYEVEFVVIIKTNYRNNSFRARKLGNIFGSSDCSLFKRLLQA